MRSTVCGKPTSARHPNFGNLSTGGDHPTIKELIDYDQFCGIVPPVPDMKQVLDNPSLGIKVIDGREAGELTAKYPKYAKRMGKRRELSFC